MTGQALVQATDLRKQFRIRRGLFKFDHVDAVKGVNLSIERGKTIALVGESGSGKSTLGRMLMRLEQPTSGSVIIDGVDISALRGQALRAFRRKVSIVFQNPYRSLNPRMSIGTALAEPLRVWRIVPSREVAAEVGKLLESVGLPADYVRRFPHELSGGERQRVAIARALSVRPEFMVADEAVSSLDVSAAAEILNLMMTLRRDMNLTCLFVTHDLSVARVLADSVVVMRRGEIVEQGPPDQILGNPQHDYTKLLINAQIVTETRAERDRQRAQVQSPEGAPRALGS